MIPASPTPGRFSRPALAPLAALLAALAGLAGPVAGQGGPPPPPAAVSTVEVSGWKIGVVNTADAHGDILPCT